MSRDKFHIPLQRFDPADNSRFFDREFPRILQQYGRALRREGVEHVGPLTFLWGTQDLNIYPTFPAYPTVESRLYVCRQCRETLGTCSCFKPAVSPTYE